MVVGELEGKGVVGDRVGCLLGEDDGDLDGLPVGLFEGVLLGEVDGDSEGLTLGVAVGCLLGEDDGALDGLAVGLAVGLLGLKVGAIEGWPVGLPVGLAVGITKQVHGVGEGVGCIVGDVVGCNQSIKGRKDQVDKSEGGGKRNPKREIFTLLTLLVGAGTHSSPAQ